MRVLFPVLMIFCCLSLLLTSAAAQDTKEVTLKGKITCAKCDLGVETACATVIVVKKEGKDTVYYFDKEGHKKNHATVCTESKQGSVTGVLSEKDKKNYITVKSLKFE